MAIHKSKEQKAAELDVWKTSLHNINFAKYDEHEYILIVDDDEENCFDLNNFNIILKLEKN